MKEWLRSGDSESLRGLKGVVKFKADSRRIFGCNVGVNARLECDRASQ